MVVFFYSFKLNFFCFYELKNFILVLLLLFVLLFFFVVVVFCQLEASCSDRSDPVGLRRWHVHLNFWNRHRGVDCRGSAHDPAHFHLPTVDWYRFWLPSWPAYLSINPTQLVSTADKCPISFSRFIANCFTCHSVNASWFELIIVVIMFKFFIWRQYHWGNRNKLITQRIVLLKQSLQPACHIKHGL